MTAANRGTPCLYNPSTDGNGSSGTRNDWWSNSTLSVGTLAGYYASLPAGTGNYYTKDANLRFAFTGTNAVTYYLCQVRTGGSTRNCNSIGTGSYVVTQLGDARVMSFTNAPSLAGKLGYNRILVERDGNVYYGYVNKPATYETARLNLDAANALLTKLGLEAFVPQ